jgi:hypothetical protein
MKPLVLYHGSRRWQGPPEVRAGRNGRMEHGPGIYLTTAYETARKYAKGGGLVLRFTIEAPLRWLEDAELSLPDALDFVAGLRGLRARAQIEEGLRRTAERMAPRLGGGKVPAATLVNLMVNHEALGGTAGPKAAEYLVRRGADASLANERNDEDWVVLFNPRKVISVEPVSAKDFDARPEWNLPRVARR